MLSETAAVLQGEWLPSQAAVDTDMQAIVASQTKLLKAKAQEGLLSKDDFARLDILEKVHSRLSDREAKQLRTDSGQRLDRMTDEELAAQLPKLAAFLPTSAQQALAKQGLLGSPAKADVQNAKGATGTNTRGYPDGGWPGGASPSDTAYITSNPFNAVRQPEMYSPAPPLATTPDAIPPDDGAPEGEDL